MSTQVAYETDHHSLFCDSIMPIALIFCFWFFLKIKKKDHISRSINSKEMFICETSIIILISWKLGLVESVQQKIKLP